jgi:RNA polymerase sigma-70 factor (ECF subfamily)
MRLAMHLTGSRESAQDIYQEAFLRAYQNLDRFRFECSFYTWVYRIVTNLCLDHLRKNQVRTSNAIESEGTKYDEIGEGADNRSNTDSERTVLHSELGARIARALNNLTPQQRAVFELKHYHGLKVHSIGETLNITEPTALSILHRATAKLRAALADVH